MIRRIALALCTGVAVLSGAASLQPIQAGRQIAPTASAGKTTVQVTAKASRSGYIVASS